jgi:hypothetical protein
MGQTMHQDFQVIGLWELDARQMLAQGLQTTLKALRQILTIRFEAPPPDFERRLEPLGLPALEHLITAALTLPTWAEFEQKVAEEVAQGVRE